MNDNNISKKLQDLAKGKNRSSTSRLREIFDDVEATLRAGVMRKDVYQALLENGFEITFKTFELLIYRIRNERRKQEITEKSPAAICGENRDTESAVITKEELINKTNLPGFGKAKHKPPTA